MNPFANKDLIKRELFYYGEKRENTLELRAKIDNLINSKQYYFNPYWGTVAGNDKYFNDLLKKIKTYCLEYSVYPVSTTLEGMLINNKSFIYYIKWFIESNEGNKNKLTEILNGISFEDTRTIVTICRLLQKGKYDNALTIEQLKRNRDEAKITSNSIIDNKNKLINELATDKTQWIGDFLNHYQENVKRLTINEQRDRFKEDFPELNQIIHIIISLLDK